MADRKFGHYMLRCDRIRLARILLARISYAI
jgi:hypothetical protein